MDDATRALLHLWDTTDEAVSRLDDPDWGRPLVPPGRRPAAVALEVGGTDVTDLVVHLTGVHYAGPDRLRSALGAAHARAGWTLTHAAPHGTDLSAQCLDMVLHTHDLLGALDRELDPDVAGPAAVEACRLVLACLPRLLAHLPRASSGMRVIVRSSPGGPVVLDRLVPTGGDGPPAVVDADATALVLLLAGRVDVDAVAGVAWSGEVAERMLSGPALAGTRG